MELCRTAISDKLIPLIIRKMAEKDTDQLEKDFEQFLWVYTLGF